MKAYYNQQGEVTITSNNVNLNLPFIEFTTCSFYKPKINLETLQLYESATLDEIEEINNENLISSLKDFMKIKKIDGVNYYNEIELSLIIILKGLLLQDLVSVNNEIEDKIKPILNEIKTGDWFNAYMKLWVTEDYVRPTHTFLAQTFDNIKVRVKDYFENNYPRE
jgi:hypothetical protein